MTPFQVNQLFQGRANQLVLGSFLLLERLGEGGMGQVFKARHRKLARIVALKVIRKERLSHPDAVRRFRREIQAAAQLSHANIVLALDADEHDGTHFFAMEYVEGVDLAHYVKQYGPMPVARACDCVRQAALGLQHAHDKGLVHRDIKPHNLLLTRQGVVKVLDMGLARLTPESQAEMSGASLTGDGVMIGTPDYVAPEQAMDARSADIRADLYSLGCTFYFLLAGRAPFSGGNALEKLLKHQSERPQSVRDFRPDVPSPVAAIVHRLLAKRPADRFQTPAELVAALAALTLAAPLAAPLAAVSATPSSLPVAPPAAPAVPTPAVSADTFAELRPDTVESDDGKRKQRRAAERKRLLLVSGASSAVLLTLVLLLVLLFQWGARHDPVPDHRPAEPSTKSVGKR